MLIGICENQNTEKTILSLKPISKYACLKMLTSGCCGQQSFQLLVGWRFGFSSSAIGGLGLIDVPSWQVSTCVSSGKFYISTEGHFPLRKERLRGLYVPESTIVEGAGLRLAAFVKGNPKRHRPL